MDHETLQENNQPQPKTKQIYCVHCKAKTDTIEAEEVRTKNNRKRLKGVCEVCGGKKSQFI